MVNSEILETLMAHIIILLYYTTIIVDIIGPDNFRHQTII